MAKTRQRAAEPVVWPDERLRSETVADKAFTAYTECPFDPIWGIEQWGCEIHGKRENGRAKLSGTGPRGMTYSEPVVDGEPWKLPPGVTTKPPFSEAGRELLRQARVVDKHADTFKVMADVLRERLTELPGLKEKALPLLTGEDIEAILRANAEALGLKAAKEPHEEAPATTQVEWDDTNPEYMPKKEAKELAIKTGWDHEIEELKGMNYGKLRNLLEGRNCTIRYMKRVKPTRGRVHRADWEAYLRTVVREHRLSAEVVEKRTRLLS